MNSNFQIETCTPVHIGSGKILSRFSDYIYVSKKNAIDIIDKQKLLGQISKSEIDAIVNQFYVTNDRNQKTFIEQVLQNNKIKTPIHSSIPCFINPKAREINRNVYSGSSPYIPGSTIKGALATAIVFDFLSKTDSGKQYIAKINNLFLGQKEKFEKLIEKIKIIEKKEYENKKQKPKDISIAIQNANLNTSFQDPFEFVFGNDPQKSFLRFIQVSDVLFENYDVCEIKEIKRVKEKKIKNKGVPILAECISKNSVGNFQLSIRKNMELVKGNTDIINMKYFETISKPETLFKICSSFYKPSDIHIPKEALGVVRIGRHKSFFNQTILGLFAADVQMYMREIYRLGEKPKTKELDRTSFPATFSYTTDNEELGWCAFLSIQKEEQKEVQEDMFAKLSDKFRVVKK